MFTSLFFITSIFCQEASNLDETLEDGNFFFFREDYVEAAYLYNNLVGTDRMNANIQYKLGICYLNIPGEEYKAIPFLEEAIKNITSKYKKRSPKETHAPEYAYYYLGNAYRINNELDKALETYNQFLNIPDFENKFNLDIINNEIKACEKSKIIQDIPVNVNIINLGKIVNTNASNYNPVISSDESLLIFMAELKFYNAIFISKKYNGIWSEPENITPQVGSDGDVVPTSISADRKVIYLIKGEGDDRDVYSSRFDGTRWTKMEPLNFNINSGKAETHASISADGKTLYFTSNRKGGFGELDIYKSSLESNGDWGPAKNLGQQINTSFNEESPFISADNTILYFSSQSHYNMGGYDIFYSVLNADNTWGPPINIGYPVNTTGDDLFFAPVGNGTIGYMSKILTEGIGKEDIYRIEIIHSEKNEIVAVKGIIDMKNQILTFEKDFDINVVDRASKQVIGVLHYNKSTGKFSYTSKNGNLSFTFEEKE